MHQSMRRVQRGSFIGYTCDRLPVRHVFTTKAGGVSTGHCESLNLGFNRGDDERNVRENYRRLAQAVLKQFPDTGAAGSQLIHTLCKHRQTSPSLIFKIHGPSPAGLVPRSVPRPFDIG